MKVKLLVSRCGPAGSQNAGDVIDVDADEAKRMFESEPPQAIPAEREQPIESTARKAKKDA